MNRELVWAGRLSYDVAHVSNDGSAVSVLFEHDFEPKFIPSGSRLQTITINYTEICCTFGTDQAAYGLSIIMSEAWY